MSTATADEGDGGASTVAASTIGDAPLGVLQRVLLTTDATVVRLLEGLFGESICTEGLGQLRRPASAADGELELAGHETILCRETLLQGSESGRNYVYAEAWVVLDRLEPNLREALLTTSRPIGYLLAADRVETFRELLRQGRRPAGPLGPRFDIEPGDELAFRTYRIVAGGAPIMLITESFPPLEFAPREEGRHGRVLDADPDADAASARS